MAGPIPLPTKKLVVPVRKTPCGEGTPTWEKWSMRIHKRLIDIYEPTAKTVDSLGKVEVPAGVFIKIKA